MAYFACFIKTRQSSSSSDRSDSSENSFISNSRNGNDRRFKNNEDMLGIKITLLAGMTLREGTKIVTVLTVVT